MADAGDLKSPDRKAMRVRVPPPPPTQLLELVRTRKPERYFSSNWREKSRGGVATCKAEAEQNCDRVPPLGTNSTCATVLELADKRDSKSCVRKDV